MHKDALMYTGEVSRDLRDLPVNKTYKESTKVFTGS